MKYRLKVSKPFGTVLDEDGRTVLGKSLTVDAGSIVEHISIGAWDMVLVSYTYCWGLVCYGWVFLNEVEEITDDIS